MPDKNHGSKGSPPVKTGKNIPEHSSEPLKTVSAEQGWNELAQLAADALEGIDRFRQQLEEYCTHNQMSGEMEETMTNFASLRQAVIHSKLLRDHPATAAATSEDHLQNKEKRYSS